MNAWLLDTGPIVAYLDSTDARHDDVARRLEAFAGRLVTSGAVVTEAMHFVAETPGGPRLLADFVASSDMRVYDLAQPAQLRDAAALMERYGDTPMDYADATLVLLADALEIDEVMTLDRRGFATYRMLSRKRFRLVMEQPSV